jgi:outer membrane protein TolC
MQDGYYTTIRPAEELSLTAENLPTAISDARADYRAMDKAFAAYNEMLKSSEKSFLPRLNAFGTFETNDDNPINAGATNYMVGMQISWNIFDGHQRSAKVQRSRAQLEKTRLEKEKYMLSNQKEFLKALRMYDQATAKLSTVRLAMENAEESLRIRSNRLAQGLEKTSDVLMAETKYSEQKLLEYQTIFEINFAKLYARFLSE